MDMIASSVSEGSRLTKEGALRDFVRFSWKATRGLTSEAETEGKELVRRMVDVGRVTPVEGERLLATLKGRMKLSRQVFEERVESSVRKAVEKLTSLSERELTQLSGQVEELEKRLDRVKGTRPGR